MNAWHTTEKAARQRLTRTFFRGQAFPRRRNVKIAVVRTAERAARPARGRE